MMKDIGLTELLELQRRGDAVLIDVRSPSEYRDATIPGSVNIPLFDDAERAEVGTLYKQVGVEAAKERGLELVSAKLPALVRAIAAEDAPRKAVFCWRGGMRSRTAGTLAALMGMPILRLTGGFRTYRRWVVERLESLESLPPCYVLSGYTGSGKTAILEELERSGYPVVNLERLAAHRGSIFGHIGREPHNQKTFESLLLQRLDACRDAPYLVVEAESKRVGKVVLPEVLVQAKESGRPLVLELPLQERVANILADYRPQLHKAQCIASFERIRKRMHTPVGAEVAAALHTERYDEAVALLLEHYYDPRYRHAAEQYEQEPVMIGAADTDDALRQVVAHLPDPRGAAGGRE
ncbi:tRNA 2-selenouridine(34) synthase MnmH [Paenibacillus sp. IB182496]|uniref:tRNA 2-selenouridine(34) synthase MnmH n=1 Tax=Paenibacillus sabuli TaxID=2772509 RepID=A0A927GUH9_9BACL|nr:tRNA 2-selenouridine(34) synthase MnmH [Paenibacillus sabuli]MBD2848175.1 tRNA 2-selenouridine(34) synthase MnmH [Paenibacillus sabuli]